MLRAHSPNNAPVLVELDRPLNLEVHSNVFSDRGSGKRRSVDLVQRFQVRYFFPCTVFPCGHIGSSEVSMVGDEETGHEEEHAHEGYR